MRTNHPAARFLQDSKNRLRAAVGPGPGIAEPEGGQYMDGRSLRAAIEDAYFDQHIFRFGFGVLDKYIKIAIIVKNPRINELVLRLFKGTFAVCLHQIGIWVRPLRIFVQIFHIGMRWGAIEVEIVLFYVLAVVALTIG